MSKQKMTNISKLLKTLANKIENYPNFIADLEIFLLNYAGNNLDREKEVDINVWELHSKGVDEFEKVINDLSIPQLINIIRKNNLDQSKLSHKWKDRKKLVELIKNRIEDRKNKGNIFLEYGKSEEKIESQS